MGSGFTFCQLILNQAIIKLQWAPLQTEPLYLPQFAEHHDIQFFFEVSAKTGDNIAEAFEVFFKEVHRKVGSAHCHPIGNGMSVCVSSVSGKCSN